MSKALLTLAVLPLFSFLCDAKKRTSLCLQGKVIRTSCASFVVQILNNDTLGEDGWKDTNSPDATVYDNVFSVANLCKLPADVKTGSTIYFNIDKPQPSGCVVCMMYDAPPATQFDCKNVTLEPCK